MSDRSDLDTKYFIDNYVYNCPFCNRRNVAYRVKGRTEFNWSNNKVCYVYFVVCSSCNKISMHLCYTDVSQQYGNNNISSDLDEHVFYSVPTSFFTIDSRIPRIIRELITEAEGCVKMNYLTGASACTRKAIYELTILEKAEGDNYEERIKFLKTKFPEIAPDLFDVLSHIKDMTSDKVHEQSWDKWDNRHLKLFLETLKVILHEIYVVPNERKKRSSSVSKLLQEAFKDKDARRAGEMVSNEQGETSENLSSEVE